MESLGLDDLGLNHSADYPIHGLTLNEINEAKGLDEHYTDLSSDYNCSFRQLYIDTKELNDISEYLGHQKVKKKANEQIGISETGEKPSPN